MFLGTCTSIWRAMSLATNLTSNRVYFSPPTEIVNFSCLVTQEENKSVPVLCTLAVCHCASGCVFVDIIRYAK